ncbi:hypothetical protein DFJ73DRAFT_815804 [Zopfochytrium polystomum]|nr:hypothetical protein DFJ73DRAFT_815804 [Zopfochytrium polystomum]
MADNQRGSQTVQQPVPSLLQEYSLLKAQCAVLKKAVLEEQTQNKSLAAQLKTKDQKLRETNQQLDLLSYHNDTLAKRIEAIQAEMKLSRSKKVMPPDPNSQILSSELESRIQQNGSELTTRLSGDLAYGLALEELHQHLSDTTSERDMLRARLEDMTFQRDQLRRSNEQVRIENQSLQAEHASLRSALEAAKTDSAVAVAELNTSLGSAASTLLSVARLAAGPDRIQTPTSTTALASTIDNFTTSLFPVFELFVTLASPTAQSALPPSPSPSVASSNSVSLTGRRSRQVVGMTGSPQTLTSTTYSNHAPLCQPPFPSLTEPPLFPSLSEVASGSSIEFARRLAQCTVSLRNLIRLAQHIWPSSVQLGGESVQWSSFHQVVVAPKSLLDHNGVVIPEPSITPGAAAIVGNLEMSLAVLEQVADLHNHEASSSTGDNQTSVEGSRLLFSTLKSVKFILPYLRKELYRWIRTFTQFSNRPDIIKLLSHFVLPDDVSSVDPRVAFRQIVSSVFEIGSMVSRSRGQTETTSAAASPGCGEKRSHLSGSVCSGTMADDKKCTLAGQTKDAFNQTKTCDVKAMADVSVQWEVDGPFNNVFVVNGPNQAWNNRSTHDAEVQTIDATSAERTNVGAVHFTPTAPDNSSSLSALPQISSQQPLLDQFGQTSALTRSPTLGSSPPPMSPRSLSATASAAAAASVMFPPEGVYTVVAECDIAGVALRQSNGGIVRWNHSGGSVEPFPAQVSTVVVLGRGHERWDYGVARELSQQAALAEAKAARLERLISSLP